jgi:predicted membrane-bound spermidine synthase
MKSDLSLTVPRNILYFAALIEGFSVMSMQLLGSRAIAPYFGSSIYMWTLTLGSTMIALAIGYYIGGILSRRPDYNSTLIKVFVVASMSFVLDAFIYGKLLVNSLSFSLDSPGTLLLLGAIFSPLIICGSLSPLIIRAFNLQVDDSGFAAGNVFATISLGGIVGAIVVGFIIIPELGTTFGLKLTAAVLGLYPILNYFYNKKILMGTSIVFILAFVLILNPKVKLLQQKGQISIVYNSDALSGNLLVLDDVTKQNRMLYMNSMAQTKMHFTGRSIWPYVYRIATFASTKPVGADALVAGIGGGNLINELYRLNFNIDAVDIDPRIGSIAKEYFKMTDKATVIVDDARHFINTSQKQYDVIVLDLSAGEVMPTNVYTIECFKKVRTMLKPNGLLFLHYLCSLDKDQVPALESIGQTLRASGMVANILDSHPKQDADFTQEFMFLASNEEPIFPASSFRIAAEVPEKLNIVVEGNLYFEGVDFTNGVVLSDNQPLLDHLQRAVVFKLREKSRSKIVAPLIELGHSISK